jgi:epoxyqueuosine reductase
MPPDAAFADDLRARCRELGFSRVGFTSALGAPGIVEYDAFLERGHHADMDWMARGRPPRADPRQMLPGATSAVVLGVDYGWPRAPDPGGLTGKVARYAWGRDYHNLISKRLRKLCAALRAEGVGATWGVDSRPFIERAWAVDAGLGYAGRNCCTIQPGSGSWFFLAVVLIDRELPPDRPLGRGLERHCGACTRCFSACPTGAFVGDGQLDARRCLSWMTIEHRGPIPMAHREALGRWVFGCDDCQEVCPHNHRPPTPLEEDLRPRPGHDWLDLERILTEDDAAIDARFEGSPLRRPGAVGLKRNAAVVLGNLGDPAARPCLMRALAHPSALVQEHARWALDRLG